MTQAGVTERENKVTIDDAGPSRKKLTIEIPAETVDERLAESLDTLALEAQLPGFRKGHAPRQLLERKFGDAIRREAKEQLVASAYSRAVEDLKLRVVGEPFSETLAEVELQPGKPLAFEIEVEVVPEFDLPELEGFEVRKPMYEVSDEEIQAEIRKLCVAEGELEQRDAPEPGDYLTGHGKMTGADGTVHYDIEGAVVQVPDKDSDGSGMILGVKVDDFAKQMGLPRPGETFTVKVKGPPNHEVEAIRNDDLTIEFRVDRVDRIIPAPIEKVLSMFAMESEDQLREAIRARLTQRALVRQQAAMRQQIADQLLEKIDIELPERLSAAQAARTLQNKRLELMYRGIDQGEIERHMAELRAASDAAAQRELKLFFILHRVAEELDIKVNEAEINARIAQLAMEQGERPEKLRQELIQRNQIGAIYQQIRDHKAMDALLEKAKITEVSPEEYEKASAGA